MTASIIYHERITGFGVSNILVHPTKNNLFFKLDSYEAFSTYDYSSLSTATPSVLKISELPYRLNSLKIDMIFTPDLLNMLISVR